MNANDLLKEFSEAGIQLWREGENLRFRAPRGVMDDRRMGELRRHKAELLTLVADTAASRAEDPVWQDRPDERDLPFPLTDIQSAYLFGRNPAFGYGGVSCHLYQELDYPADLDPARLQSAWDGMVRRHDALRTIIHEDGTQRVLPEAEDTRIAVADLRDASAEEVAEALAAVRDELSHAVHPTGERPMYALRLTLAADRSVLHLSVDFMALDWLSIQQVLTELDLRYRQPDCALPEIDATYRDYVAAEHRLRETERYARDRAYWWNRVDELPGPPVLPLRDDHDPATAAPRFRRLTTTLDDRVWQALKARAAEQGSTPANAVLAAYVETIGRWSATARFCVGLPVLNRLPLHPSVDRLLGDFTSLSLLAVDHGERTSFAERARALGERLFDDLDHRLFSGVEVLREIARRRGREEAMLPVVFTGSIGVGGGAVSAAGRKPRPSYGISQTPQVWIDCQVGDQFGGLDVNWDIREGTFPDGLVDDMFAAFEALLHRLAEGAEPWTAVDPQPLPEHQRTRRSEVNATDAPVPEGLLHDPLVARARAFPDQVAVIDPEGTLTYAEWLGGAAAVAERLRSEGCRPGDFVGVLVDKCRDQAVAVLGILLAGGVYVPVDPGQPRIRRDRILTDCGAGFAVVADAATGELPEGVRAVTVAGLRPVPLAEIPEGPRVAPDDLAYVMHTSGSTGVPKGVMISHRAALNTVVDINDRFGVGDTDRVLGLAALSFDLSVYDLFGPPAVGATLVLPDPARRGDPSHWAEVVAEHGVTLWNSVPAQLQMLLYYLDAEPAGPKSLRLALLSGDWIPLTLPAHAGRHLPGTELISLGGATEAAIWSIHHPITTVAPDWRSIPYGVPLANQRFHVLDTALRDRPDLVAGELYIAGTGLATGYLNDPDRTAERFVHHPETKERLYRTGDLGRYLPSGEIEFLGRADQQVKIRGHRIELGEIEAVLGEHPMVGTSVVLAAGDSAFERALVAFVIPRRESGSVEADELIGWVADRLPAHMIPARVRLVEALPLTPNGKVDRKRLLASAPTPTAPRDEPSEPPRPGVERRIADLWAETLGAEPPSRDAGFFDVGGDSLLAARFVGRVREVVPEAAHLTFDLLLRALLDTPTVAGLARSLGSDAEAAPATDTAPAARTSSLVPLNGSGTGPVRLLVHDGSGTLAPYAALITELGAEAPLFGVVAPGGDRLDLAAPDLVQELAGGYAREVLAAGFDGVEIIGHGLGGPIALELARALGEADATVRRLTLVSSHRVPSPPQDAPADDHAPAGATSADPAVLARIHDAVAQYDPLPYAGDLTFLRPAGSGAGVPGPTDDTSAFWRDVCLGDVTVVDVTGDHAGCLRAPHVARLADALTARPAERR